MFAAYLQLNFQDLFHQNSDFKPTFSYLMQVFFNEKIEKSNFFLNFFYISIFIIYKYLQIIWQLFFKYF